MWTMIVYRRRSSVVGGGRRAEERQSDDSKSDIEKKQEQMQAPGPVYSRKATRTTQRQSLAELSASGAS